jgi:DNA-binding transcriptional ArsR family regulator
MIPGPLIAEIAAPVGEPARATMLSALLDGRALTASELCFAARGTPQTASTHLAKLTEAGLLLPIREGRHRYFRLASPKVVEILDGVMAVALENRPGARDERSVVRFGIHNSSRLDSPALGRAWRAA